MQNGKVPYLPTAGESGYVRIEETPIQPSPIQVEIISEKKPPSGRK
jgi:hypothetical protein